MEVVFHTASLIPVSILNTPEAMERVNVKGTKNVIQACQQCGIKRLIYTSTATVTLSKDPTLHTELIDESAPFPKDPLNAYVRTKGEAERAVRDANDEDGLHTCALRLGGILGILTLQNHLWKILQWQEKGISCLDGHLSNRQEKFTF